MPFDHATMGWLAGALAVSLLVMGGAGASVVRQRRHRALAPTDGPVVANLVSRPYQPLAIRRTAFSGTMQVVIQSFAFEPAEARVAAGTTIVWTNQDLVPHTVTLRNGMADSGLMRPGQAFSHTFASPGVFEYYCRVHPSMVGSVVVTA
jgi:plastocyanin